MSHVSLGHPGALGFGLPSFGGQGKLWESPQDVLERAIAQSRSPSDVLDAVGSGEMPNAANMVAAIHRCNPRHLAQNDLRYVSAGARPAGSQVLTKFEQDCLCRWLGVFGLGTRVFSVAEYVLSFSPFVRCLSGMCPM